MSEAQNNLPASHVEAGSRDSVLDHSSGLPAGADGHSRGEFAIGKGGELGGHTLLSRLPAPQGRRSLFRR